MVLLSNELVELRVEHINGRSFLGEVECEHNGFTNFENLTKIENIEALDNFDAILEETDGIMVARGDLGVEIPMETLANIQKQMVIKCNLAGNPNSTLYD